MEKAVGSVTALKEVLAFYCGSHMTPTVSAFENPVGSASSLSYLALDDIPSGRISAQLCKGSDTKKESQLHGTQFERRGLPIIAPALTEFVKTPKAKPSQQIGS